MASARRHTASEASGSGEPLASMAEPPQSACSNSKETFARRATVWSTRTASGVTSCPIPSPGSTAIVCVVI